MSNQWLRLWHDMPTDPKWRTVARVAKQPITNVISVYVHMLVCASTATERGRTQGWNDEDVASALDLETDQVVVIREAMQSRVLEGDRLLEWSHLRPPGERPCRPSAEVWIIIRRRIFLRDNYTCRYCGKRGVRLECDHVVPVSRGGSHEDSNLATACFGCNRSKRAKTPSEWKRCA
jgi:hypothetical protein